MKALSLPGGERCVPHRGEALTGWPAAPIAVGLRLLLFVAGELANGFVGAHLSGSILFVCDERWNKSLVFRESCVGGFFGRFPAEEAFDGFEDRRTRFGFVDGFA